VRVIAATSRDLKRDVAEGKFREDLFYRLEVFTIELPPLRERIDDIPLLVEHFLVKHGERLGRPGIRCSAAALKILLAHGWPGNIRELENAIERGVILCDDDLLEPSALPSQLGGEGGEITYSPQLPAGNFSIKQAEVELEKELIRRALEKTGGNRTHAARLLEISPRALLYKLKEYGIE
jgi:two-component system response regulator AtoC